MCLLCNSSCVLRLFFTSTKRCYGRMSSGSYGPPGVGSRTSPATNAVGANTGTSPMGSMPNPYSGYNYMGMQYSYPSYGFESWLPVSLSRMVNSTSMYLNPYGMYYNPYQQPAMYYGYGYPQSTSQSAATTAASAQNMYSTSYGANSTVSSASSSVPPASGSTSTATASTNYSWSQPSGSTTSTMGGA